MVFPFGGNTAERSNPDYPVKKCHTHVECGF